MWTPTHIVVTVLRARNLLDKGKGGNDAYCMIGMGKEKFLTSVRAKNLSPVWDEQAEFELSERADLKLTVYHKSSIIDEFIGRVVINISEMAYETNRSFTKWFKLQAKPDKAESKKPDKERGEIEVRVEFVIKPKTGSVMNLSIKNNEKSLSLKNLKDKSLNIKASLGDKFKILQKPRKPKFTGENQLAEQAKQMNGSKLDFLDGEDVGSLTSSYSSINGSTFSRIEEAKPAHSMGRFHPTRSSFISRNSSRMDNDSSSMNDTNNDDEFNDENQAQNELESNQAADSTSFNRNNSFRKSSLRRQSIKRSSGASSQLQQTKEDAADDDSLGKIHIAPLPAFLNAGQAEEELSKSQRYQVLSSIIMEEPQGAPALPPLPPTSKINNRKASTNSKSDLNANNGIAPAADSFASIFTASLADSSSSDQKNSIDSTNDSQKEQPTQQKQRYSTPNSSQVKLSNANSNPFLNSDSTNDFLQIDTLIVTPAATASLEVDPFAAASAGGVAGGSKSETSPKSLLSNHSSSMTTLVKSEAVKNLKSNSYFNNNDDDEDQIDWASSEDEEIVKQEVESFERNQILRQSERKRLIPTEDLTSDLNSETDFNSNGQQQQTLSSKSRSGPFGSGDITNSRAATATATGFSRSNMQINLNNRDDKSKLNEYSLEDEIKTPDFDAHYGFHTNESFDASKLNTSGKSDDLNSAQGTNNGLPDLINQKESSDKARKYLEGLDGVKFNEIQVPDSLKKQLEYFDRDELLQLIAYQKKYLDFKESRIKDLENYIDNLIVKIIETEPLILMNASSVLNKPRNII